MDALRRSNTDIYSSFLRVNVRISVCEWGEGRGGEGGGSTESKEINKTQTPYRKSGTSASTPGCSHTQSDSLMKQLLIQSCRWPLSGPSPSLAVLKKSGPLLFDIVFTHEPLTSGRKGGGGGLHGMGGETCRGSKLTCAAFSASSRWRNVKKNCYTVE